MEHLAFAFINPPAATPAPFIRRAIQEIADGPPFALLHSSHGAGVMVFATSYHREHAMNCGPYVRTSVSED
jgi:hypothetical protein